MVNFSNMNWLKKKKAKNPSYDLVVENLKSDKGCYSDVIILTTDSDVRPQLRIRVNGNIKEISRDKAAPVGKTSP